MIDILVFLCYYKFRFKNIMTGRDRKMNQIIERYIRKILEIGCNIQNNDNLIVYSQSDISDFEEILLKIKDEYKINQVIFIRNNYEKIYNFLKNNPSEEDIQKFIIKYPMIQEKDKVKIISVMDDDHSGYYYKLCYEIYNLYEKYCQYDSKTNKELYDLFDNCVTTVIICPTNSWAKSLFGSDNQKDKLWNLVDKCMPKTQQLKEEIKRLKEIKNYLNKVSISQLYFYTNIGTDFRIGLSKYSKWVSEPEIKNGIEYFFNFPSYEIFTSPDYNSAEGKVVITKPSCLYGKQIKSAELQFLKGKCISCESDNKNWDGTVLNHKNDLYRIGEIALVSKDTPLAKMNRTFNSLLLDENTGCHLALGHALLECVNMPEDILLQKGLKHYNFNASAYHQDLVFGDDSITVEAKTKDKRKILLMENGIWKI